MKKQICLAFVCLGAAAAMAQQSGPLVTGPSLMATTDSLANIAARGEATAFSIREFRVSRSHDIPKGTADLRARISTEVKPSVTVGASTPYAQTANFRPMNVPVLKNFEALGVGTPGFTVTGAPPDTTLGVSPTQIVQWVNSQLAVYDKAGNPLLPAPGFLNGNQIWSAFPEGSLCRQFNRGDPILQFDKHAQRWVLSQFAFNSNFTDNAQCIAVSTSSNALGSYTLYQYGFGNVLPDYGKLGVWSDAYHLSYNMFTQGSSFAGAKACAYDRAAMIAGLPATQICFGSTARFSYLPADLDGFNLPPAGSPAYYVSWDWAFKAAAPYVMQLTKFKPDFVNPALSTFDDGFGGVPFSFVGFDLGNKTLASCNDNGSTCVPQLGTTQRLDTLGSRHMYRLVYRNFGGHEALLFTQATDENAIAASADLRWWEIRNPGAAAPVVHQSSTYRPSADFRWMASAAFDKVGNIGIGYSASSSTINPSIRIAGRWVTDPKNLLRTEQTVQVGTGSQTLNLSRWGDYSTMQTDPVDDCTLWYTTQYIGTNGSFNWRTRIVGFKFPNCS